MACLHASVGESLASVQGSAQRGACSLVLEQDDAVAFLRAPSDDSQASVQA